MMWLHPKIRANIATPDGSAANGVLEMVRNAENGSSFFSVPCSKKSVLRRSADEASATGNFKTLVWRARSSNEGFETALPRAFPRIEKNK